MKIKVSRKMPFSFMAASISAIVASAPFSNAFSADLDAVTSTTPEKAAAAPAALAGAATPPSETISPATPVQTVEVRGTARFDARREESVTKIVVSQAELVRFGDTTLAESLTHFPGITLTSSGGIAMRGLGNGYVQILLNGEKMPTGFNLDSLSPALIERVEILRAGTADIGTQAIAGTINVILKKTARSDQGEFKGGLESGNGVSSPSVSLQRTSRSGPLSYTLGGSFSRKDVRSDEIDHWTGTDAVGAPNYLMNSRRHIERRFDVLGFAPRFSYELPSGNTISSQTFLSVDRLHKTIETVSTASLDPLKLAPYGADNNDALSENALLRSDINLLQKLTPDSKLDTKIGFFVSRRNGTFTEQGITQSGSINLDGKVVSSVNERGVTTTGKYTNSLHDGHVLGIGWDGGDTRRKEDRIENADIYLGIPASNMQFEAGLGRLALYVQDEWSVTKRFSLYLGLRWEGLSVSSEGDSFSPVHNRSGIFFPVLQSIWKPVEGKDDQVRLAITRTYNPPSIAQLIPRPYTTVNNNSVNPDRQGNPGLRPQVAMGLDVAYEHYWSKDAMFSISAYLRNIDDNIADDIRLIGTRWVQTPINNGSAKTRGLEFDTNFPLTFAGPGVVMRGNLTRNWSSVDSVPGPNNRLNEQPRWSGTLGVDYRRGDGNFSAGASFRYKSGGPIRISTEQFEDASPVRQFDVFGLWTVWPKTNLRLTLVNLMHQETTNEYAHVDQNGRLTDVLHKRPASTLRFSLERKF
jgi:outer membrane receptor protein involved in Fe transport